MKNKVRELLSKMGVSFLDDNDVICDYLANVNADLFGIDAVPSTKLPDEEILNRVFEAIEAVVEHYQIAKRRGYDRELVFIHDALCEKFVAGSKESKFENGIAIKYAKEMQEELNHLIKTQVLEKEQLENAIFSKFLEFCDACGKEHPKFFCIEFSYIFEYFRTKLKV